MPKISELVEKTGLIGSEFVAIQDANVTKKTSLASIGAIIGGGGATVTVSDTAPVAENEGDLWYTPTDGALYVWITGSLNAWVQTNGGGGGGGASVTVSDTAPADAGEGDLWFDDVNATLYVYLAGTTNAWIQISGGGQSGGGTGQLYAFRTPNITSEGSYTYNYPAEWTGGTPDEIFVTTVYPTNDAYSRSNFQLVSFDATSVTVYCQNEDTPSADVYCNILLVKGGAIGGGSGGASVTASDTAPTAPGDGDLWFDTSVMELYVYVAAESSWIQTNGGGGGSVPFTDAGWQTVSRSVNTTYTNTTNYPIQVAIYTILTGYVATTDWFFVDDQPVASVGGSGASANMPAYVYAIVPAGSTYRLAGVSGVNAPTSWKELVGGTGAAGSGGGDGPRAYVAFNGNASNLSDSIYGSLNVTSITDNSTGNYTVNLNSTLTNGVVMANAYAAGGGPGVGGAPALDGVDVLNGGSFNGVKVQSANVNGYQDYGNVSVIVH